MGLKGEFLKEVIQMANKYGQNCLMYVFPRGMHAKTSVRLHTTLIQWLSSKTKQQDRLHNLCIDQAPGRNLGLLPINDIHHCTPRLT